MRYKIEKIKKFPQEELRESMEDAMEDAREQMEHQLEEGFLPEITVPLKYKEAISKGITKTSCWLGEGVITGTLVRKPYLPAGEKRILVRIKNISVKQIKPKLTGPERKYQNVVTFYGPISS